MLVQVSLAVILGRQCLDCLPINELKLSSVACFSVMPRKGAVIAYCCHRYWSINLDIDEGKLSPHKGYDTIVKRTICDPMYKSNLTTARY